MVGAVVLRHAGHRAAAAAVVAEDEHDDGGEQEDDGDQDPDHRGHEAGGGVEAGGRRVLRRPQQLELLREVRHLVVDPLEPVRLLLPRPGLDTAAQLQPEADGPGVAGDGHHPHPVRHHALGAPQPAIITVL